MRYVANVDCLHGLKMISTVMDVSFQPIFNNQRDEVHFTKIFKMPFDKDNKRMLLIL